MGQENEVMDNASPLNMICLRSNQLKSSILGELVRKNISKILQFN